MELKIFNFIEEVIGCLEEISDELQNKAKDLEIYFEKLLENNNDGDIKVSSRVKSSSSLREKIIRK